MSLPLEGVRVLDLSRLLPGGFCSLLLADFGADVLKVEDTGMGDYVRWAAPFYEGADRSAASALFLALNRGKRSIRIDLKQPDGRDVLLRAARDADVLLESFRPGVLDRLGVGYEALREVNPGLVYCAITGYGQDGPFRDRAGHDLNYLARMGLLGLSGDPDGPPVQAAGQIADLGGGAMMAAFGILAALRERDRSGEGQLVDVSMADGALSWLAMVAARYFADGAPPAPRRARARRRAALLPALPLRRRLGRARRAGAEVLAGVVPRGRARGPGRAPVRPAGLGRPPRGRGGVRRPHPRGVGGVRRRARLLPGARARARRGAGLGARALARDGRARSSSPAPSGRCACWGCRSSSRARRATRRGRPGRCSARTPTPCSPALGYAAEDVERLKAAGAVAGPRRRGRRELHVVKPGLKMSELAGASGVSAGTIKHYLREGLLGADGEIVRTSRNMAYYPPEFVERIRRIKRLQEERFLPLRLIKGLLDGEERPRVPRDGAGRARARVWCSTGSRRSAC